MKQGSKPSKNRLVFEQLEPRVLFSADPLAAAVGSDLSPANVEESSVLRADLFPASSNAAGADVAAEVRRELVFVDTTVPDYQRLVDDLLASGDDARQFEVVVLDGDRDGVTQIADTVAGRHGIDAIHIVSHGSPAELQLGSARLTIDSMTSQYTDELALIGQALTDSADLLIYGCNFGQGDLGQHATTRLAQLTGADVATSIDATGGATVGGDWVLEHRTGAIETDVAFSQSLQQNWEHTLNVTIDNTSADTTPSFAPADTVSHTTSGSDRLMLVGISFGADQNDTVASVTYNGTALTRVGEQESSASDQSRVEIWALVVPDLGTHDVDVIFSGTNHEGATIGVMTFNGVDQTTPLGPFAGAESESSNPSVTVSSALGELVFGVVAFNDNTDWDMMQGPGQTEHWDLYVDQANGAGTTEAGAPSVVTSWTVGDTKKWAAGGVSIKPSIATSLAVDASSSGSTPDQASVTVSHTTSGSNRLMLVGVGTDPHGDSVDSITYNGVNLTLVGTEEDPGAHSRVEIWALVAPDTGTHDVIVNMTGTSHRGVTVGVTTFTGVDQATPLVNFSSDFGNGTTASTTVASATDDVVFGVVHSHNGTAVTEGPGQTEQWDVVADQSNGGGTVEAGAPSVITSWTVNNDDWSVAAVAVQAASASGALTATGEFMVNDPSASDEVTSGPVRGAERAVDIAPDGNYVVVWTEESGTNHVWAKVLDKDGSEKVAQFQVDTAGGNAEWADVAIADNGDFVVTWTLANDIYMRRFQANGTPMDAADVLVNTTTPNVQQNPSINMNGAGDFVIAWEGTGGASEGIYARLGSMAGGLIGTDITVNTAAAAQDPSVGIADSGNFVVVWDDGNGVYYQLFNPGGGPLASGQVDVAATNASHAAVDMAGDGRFTVVHRETAIGFEIYARQFDAAGTPAPISLLVNSSFAGDQTNPSVSMDDSGDFIVVWEGVGDQAGHIDADSGVFGQKYDAGGNKIGSEFRINQTTANVQDQASVAMLDLDNFVVVWTGSDGAQTDIFARQYGTTILDPGLWLATEWNGSGPGASWNEEEIVQLTDPNLQFGTPSNGTFSNMFNVSDFATGDFYAQVDAVHYVRSNVTVGGNTQAAITLQNGDLLFSVREGSETLGGLTVYDEDVVAFRPDTPGDYTSGTFFIVLDGNDPDLALGDLTAITLVEQTTTLPDGAVLPAGTFLFARETNDEKNIYHFTADDVGRDKTTGTVSLLLDGSALGFSDAIVGLELIERDETVGGYALSQGDILVTLNTFDGAVGTNNLANVDEHDIVVLTVTQSEFMFPGDSKANAAFFLEGSDVSLSTPNENIYALSLVAPTAGTTNSAPTLDLDADNSSGATGNDYQFTFTEGDGPTAIADIDTDLVDPDSTTFDHVTLSITGLLDGNAEILLLDGDIFALATAEPGKDTSGALYHVVVVPGAGSASVTITKQGGGTFTEAETESLIKAVQYQHTDTDAPSDGDRRIDVTVNDGFADSVPARTTIDVEPVNDEQVLAVNTGVTVAEASTGTVITSAMLATTDADHTPAQLTYTVTAATGNGTLRLSGTALSVSDTFTQADIDAGFITYDHDGSETLSDSFDFSVDDGVGVATNASFAITVTPVNDEQVLAVNTGVTVAEASTGTVITSAMLATTDADHTPAQLTYTVTAATGNGTLRLSGTALSVSDTFTQADIDAGFITYDHDGSETLSDSFDFSVDDGVGVATNASFAITVTPVNDEQVLAVNTGVTVAEASTGTVITSAMLATTDADHTPAQLTYTVTAATGNGTLRLSGTALSVSDTFTQADIDAGFITYDHDGSETLSDSFDFSVDDGVGVATNASFAITVTPVNDEQVLAVNTGVTVAEASTGTVITSAMLATTDADHTPAQLTYTVTAATGNGTLRLSGTALSVSDTFTQADIDAGFITYDHDGSETLSDSFDFSVDDGVGVATNASFAITVTPVNDGPVNTVPGSQATPQDTTLVFSSGNGNQISISDIDAGGNPVQVTLTANNGTLTLSGIAGLSFSLGDGTADVTMTFTGTVSDINTALNGLMFDPTTGYNGPASVQIIADDQGNTGLGGALNDNDIVNITVGGVNDAPINTVPGPQTTDQDIALVFSSGGGNQIGISDIDAGGNPVQVTLTATNGTLTLSGIAGLSFSTGDGTADATMVFAGTISDINAALDGLTFDPTPGFGGPASVKIDTNDQGNTGTGGPLIDTDIVAIVVNPVIIVPDPDPDPIPPPDPDPDPDPDPPPPEEEPEDVIDIADDPEDVGGSTGSSGGPSRTTNPVREGLADAVSDALVEVLQAVNPSISAEVLRQTIKPAALAQEIESFLSTSEFLSESEFLNDLDRVRDSFDEATDLEKTYVASTIAISSGLSIGYVVWLIRSGLLLSTLLSSLPAWQLIDPLPVLAAPAKKKDKKGAKDRQDGSLESMFEDKAATADTAETNTSSGPKARKSRWPWRK